MDRNDFLAALQRDAGAFADSCAVAGLDASVPTCPNWRVADLVWHVIGVHEFWGKVVAERWSEPAAAMAPPERPADAELPARSRAAAGAMIEALRATDDDIVVWNWSGTDQNAAWVLRRMAHEMAMHRADADAAAARPLSIEPTLASDGIDEFLNRFLWWVKPDAEPVAGSVHIHCTDVKGEWTIRETESGFDVTAEHAKGDCALRGPASDLLLALWRRVPLSTVDVVGDADVAARFVAYSALG